MLSQLLLQKFAAFWNKYYSMDYKEAWKDIQSLYNTENHHLFAGMRSLMLYHGQGTQQDKTKAKELAATSFEKLRAEKSDVSYYILGAFVVDGIVEDKNPKQALDYFMKADKKGCIEATFQIGHMYQFGGPGIKVNGTNAVKYYEKAAAKNHLNAVLHLKEMFTLGKSVQKDPKKAFMWTDKAAALKHIESMWQVANLFMKFKEMKNAFTWIKLIADLNDLNAIYQLGLMYHDGTGTDQSYGEAFKCILQAADRDHIEAMFTVGFLYLKGRGTTPSEALAFKWYRKAAVRNHSKAMCEIALFYDLGKGEVKQSDEDARIWYTKAADLGHALAAFCLAEKYETGIGIVQNFKQAKHYYEIAADGDIIAAHFNLAEILYTGPGGIAKDKALSLHHFERAADLAFTVNNATNAELIKKASLRIADIILEDTERYDNEKVMNCILRAAEFKHPESMYQMGLSCIVDKKAQDWFESAAEQGHTEAEAQLGYLYFTGGHGIEHDDKKAIEYSTKAANKGSAKGMNTLGSIYYFGRKEHKDLDQAKHWFRKAIKNNNSAARNNLGKLYEMEGNEKKALKLFKEGIEEDCTSCMLNMGLLFLNTKNKDLLDNKEGFKWVKKSAEMGLKDAMAELSKLYKQGRGTDANKTEAKKWQEKSGEKDKVFVVDLHEQAELTVSKLLDNLKRRGDKKFKKELTLQIKAMQKIASLPSHVFNDEDLGHVLESVEAYHQGTIANTAELFDTIEESLNNVDKNILAQIGQIYLEDEKMQDHDIALHFFEIAAKKDQISAQYYLGHMHYSGLGTAVNYDQAFYWMNKVALQNDAPALYYVARMYANGHGADKDIDATIEYLEKAAELGHHKSMFELGHIFYNGEVTKQDYEKALFWLKKAAEENEAAIFKVAEMYRLGHGCEENMEEAIVWYDRATNKGSIEAMNILACMHALGIGTKKNFGTAKKLLQKALASGANKESIATNMQNLKSTQNLSGLQLKAAQRTALKNFSKAPKHYLNLS